MPFLKRAFILHASKLLGLAVFWAAMRQPGAIGWLLTCKHTIYSLSLQLKQRILIQHVIWPLFTSTIHAVA